MDSASAPHWNPIRGNPLGKRRNLRVRSPPLTVSGATVTLTLSTAVAHGETVTLTYGKPSDNPLRDVQGNQVEGFSGLAGEPITTPRRPAGRPSPDVGGGCADAACPDAPIGYAVPGPRNNEITMQWRTANTGARVAVSWDRWFSSIKESTQPNSQASSRTTLNQRQRPQPHLHGPGCGQDLRCAQSLGGADGERQTCRCDGRFAQATGIMPRWTTRRRPPSPAPR